MFQVSTDQFLTKNTRERQVASQLASADTFDEMETKLDVIFQSSVD